MKGYLATVQGSSRLKNAWNRVRLPIYLILFTTSSIALFWGYLVKSENEATFHGDLSSGNLLSQGTELYLAGDELQEGTFRIMADQLFVPQGQGGRMTLSLRVTSVCDVARSQNGYEPVDCIPVAKSDFFAKPISTDRPLNLSFDAAMRVVAKVQGIAFSIRDEPVQGSSGRDRTIAVSGCKVSSGVRADVNCANSESVNEPMVVLELINLYGARVIIGNPESGQSKMLLRDRDGLEQLKSLRLSPNDGDKKWVRLRTGQNGIDLPFDLDFRVGEARFRETSGTVRASNAERPVFPSDMLVITSDKDGRIEMSDESVSTRFEKVSAVRLGSFDSNTATTNYEDIRPRRLNTWPPWVQAVLGVLVSGLVVQEMIKKIVPEARRS